MGFSTDAIHAGQHPDPVTGAISTPVYLTSTYAQDELGRHKGYEYGRTHSLTRQALEANIAALEKGKYGIAFSSGLAAIHNLMGLMKSGEHMICSDNVYGGTFRLLEQNLSELGLNFSWVDTSDLENVKNAVTENTKMVYVETPTNPMLRLTDISAAAEFCKERNLLLIVDNTFMSPYFQNPLKLGADIVIHSTTKYINGHCDVVGGIVVTSNESVHERLRYLQNAAGAVPSPFDCWLTLRATKTLALRMQAHNSNAKKVAEMLEAKIPGKVIYPGLESHPHNSLAKKQMSGFGGMVSVDVGNYETAKRFIDGLKIFTLAESLGGVESLVCHPASMTHASVPENDREKLGITDGLVRLSVGIEDVEDLIQDINQALN